MKQNILLTFTFIVDFRGGTYCTQVQATSVNKALFSWTENLKQEKKEILYLGNKTIKELEIAIQDEDHRPVLLNRLKNIWYCSYCTRQGQFSLNIVQTDIN